VALAWCGAAGCATRSGEGLRVARYQPDVPRVVLTSDRGSVVTKPSLEAPRVTPGGRATAVAPAGPGGALIRNGDRIAISLRGIPQPEEVKEVVDDGGMVNLPFVNDVKIAGMTSSEAEKVIQDAYIKGGYYSSITVIVVTQEDQYFVLGEVKREGGYPLSSERTLLEAISIAGGYAEFANPSRITIRRGGEELRYNAKRIESLEERDPLIQAGDIIRVHRKRL